MTMQMRYVSSMLGKYLEGERSPRLVNRLNKSSLTFEFCEPLGELSRHT